MSAPAFDSARPGTGAGEWAYAWTSRDAVPLTLDGVRRVVVVGAHPDDECLGAGGLIATAIDRGCPVDLVCVTDGRGSHPRSPTHRPEELAVRRRQEWWRAADRLGVDPGRRHLLDLPDGEAESHVDAIARVLVELVGRDAGVVVVAPWREDGHPDHEAVGRAAAAAARRTDATLWEFPVWFWHWARPDHSLASLLRPLPVAEGARQRKAAAIDAHATQVRPLSDLPGDERMLSFDVLAHFEGSREWFVATPGRECPDDSLDRLHRESEDPWGVDSRWYERRKADLLLGMLPRPRFARTLEVGCSTGGLTSRLADRSDAVVGVDESAAAVEAAQRRLGDRAEVTIERLDVATAWPAGGFDLVVVSEVGYFLSPRGLESLVGRVGSCLAPDGVVVLCHWRHPVSGWLLTADDVHRAFADGSLPPLRATYRDEDVEIRVLARTWPEHDR